MYFENMENVFFAGLKIQVIADVKRLDESASKVWKRRSFGFLGAQARERKNSYPGLVYILSLTHKTGSRIF